MISGSALKLFWVCSGSALGVVWVYRSSVSRCIFAYSSNGFAVFIEKRNRLRAFFHKLHFCDVNKQVSAEQKRKTRVRIEETSHRRSVSRFECSGKMVFRADSSSGFAVFMENRTSPRTFFQNSHFFDVITSISVRKF